MILVRPVGPGNNLGLVVVNATGEFEVISKWLSAFSLFVFCIIPQTNAVIISVEGLLHGFLQMNVWAWLKDSDEGLTPNDVFKLNSQTRQENA